MTNTIKVNDRLLADGWITPDEHARLVVRDGEVWDDADAAFDLLESGDVKLRDSLVVLRDYATQC